MGDGEHQSKHFYPIHKCSRKSPSSVRDMRLTEGLSQWFLILLEVLNPTSYIHAFIEPFVVGVFFLIQNICI